MKANQAEPRMDVVFRALSDRTRLRILNLLTGGDLCVCDLVEVLGVHQPTASRHLAYLRKAGLVQVRKEGLWAYYRLAPAETDWQARLLECVHACCRGLPPYMKDNARLRRRPASGCREG